MPEQLVEKTTQEEQSDRLLDTLAELGGQRINRDELKFQGKEMILPADMNVSEAIDYLREWKESQEEVMAFSKRFPYRPWDGAHATEAALRKVFGSSGIQQAEWYFWSKTPPRRHEIKIGYDKTTHVPWGNIKVPLFQGVMSLGTWTSPTFGALFQMSIECAKKYEAHTQAIFTLIGQELKNNSIYRGKAIDGAPDPNFIDLSAVKPERVIYSQEALGQLEANIWALMKRTDRMRELRLPLKRAVLLHGPYGTGKTLAAFRTAQIASENDWTFIYCRPGQDDLTTTLQMARLYPPAVVFVEDLDSFESKLAGGADVVSHLLDAFDGITTKGTEVVMVLTTNHPERINKAMLRPGRLDAVVEIGALDQEGVQRMVEALVPEGNREKSLGYAAIYFAMEDFMPAFVKEAIDRALRYAIARDDAKLCLTTQDFVGAAEGLKAQLRMMLQAAEPKTSKDFEAAFRSMFRTALDGFPIRNYDDEEPVLELSIGNSH